MKPYPSSISSRKTARPAHAAARPLAESLEQRRLLAASTFDEITALRASADRSVDGGFAVTVNFQPDGMANVANTRGDFGRLYGERGNGLTYGWNRDLEAAGDVFDRDTTIDDYSLTASTQVGIDERYDTGVELELGDEWSIDVPDGKTYAVAIVSGDPNVADPDRASPQVWTYLDVNGTLFLNGRLQPQWAFAEVSGYVEAGEDGRITISVDERTQNGRLLWVRIAEVEPFPSYGEGENVDWFEAIRGFEDEYDAPLGEVRRGEGGGGLVGDEVVTIGGFDVAYEGVWQRVDAIDVNTRESRALAPIPEGAANTHAASVVDDARELIYYLGGEVGLENSEGYEVVNDARVFDPNGGADGNG